jgi:hypothetical protein
MAKRNLITRKQRYTEILKSRGIEFNDCVVLSFVFEKGLGPAKLHLRLLNTEPRPEYHLFDRIEKVANLVVPKNEKNVAKIQEIAESLGGKKTTPDLR